MTLPKHLFASLCSLTAVVCLPACAPVPPVGPLPGGVELIALENEPGPFCGSCDSIKVTAMSDGRVWIEHGYWAGRYTDWTVERRLKHIPIGNFVKLCDHLSRYRPKGVLALNHKPPCETFWNDVDGVRVQWRDGTNDDKLFLNFGCDPEAKKSMADALKSAPSLLGISSLKMPWGQWVATTPR